MIALYMDENVKRAITSGLEKRGIDVLRVQDDGYAGRDDRDVLDRSTELGRVLFSQDDDLLREATHRQRQGNEFSGVIYAHQVTVPIGRCIEDLIILAQAGNMDDFAGRVYFLPL